MLKESHSLQNLHLASGNNHKTKSIIIYRGISGPIAWQNLSIGMANFKCIAY